MKTTNRIVCTVCSRRKNEDPALMPAYLRYQGPHIQIAKAIADKEGFDFVILSGKYGLISGDKKIPYYDYLLIEDAVANLVGIVSKQLYELGVTELELYAEPREGNWIPYYEVIERATGVTGTKLTLSLTPSRH